ncbi:MAG TPA: glucose 1-dehydrogenase [Bryobacteraceae bacterium]|nr:glucose 1-dehydrogenase [Bryobacteraceae bacterium]
MKGGAVFPGARKLGVVNDVPEPKLPSATGVRLRMLQVGICGTDREIASWMFGAAPEGFDYLVIGHEGLAEVIDAGPEVRGIEPGDLVIPTVRRPCADPACIACRNDRADFCTTGAYTEHGIQRMHGFLTERVTDEARYMRKAPPAVRDVAVLVEPLTIAEKAFLQAEKVQTRLPWEKPAPNALVLGAGPVGLLGAMALRLRGCAVTVYSREPETDVRAGIARAIGAKYASAKDETLTQMAKSVGNIDLIYEATGSPHVAFESLEALGSNGLLLLTGVPGAHAPEPLDLGSMMTRMTLRNQCLLATVNAGSDAFERAISDLTEICARWPDAVRGLITRRFGLDEFETPLRDASGIKSIIQIAS